MEWLQYVVASLFLILGAGCVILVVFQLPGGWIMLALAGIIEYADRLYLDPPDRWTFPWWVLALCVALAGLGELIELVAGLLGTRHGGGTRRGMIGALIGGVVGIFVFTPLFFFVPVFGSLFGAILGTFVGAVVGEMSGEETSIRGSMKPAFGATVGRVLGTMSKIGIAMSIWLALSVAAFWP